MGCCTTCVLRVPQHAPEMVGVQIEASRNEALAINQSVGHYFESTYMVPQPEFVAEIVRNSTALIGSA